MGGLPVGLQQKAGLFDAAGVLCDAAAAWMRARRPPARRSRGADELDAGWTCAHKDCGSNGFERSGPSLPFEELPRASRSDLNEKEGRREETADDEADALFELLREEAREVARDDSFEVERAAASTDQSA